jgi:NitT/TauT family transport system permease protein
MSILKKLIKNKTLLGSSIVVILWYMLHVLISSRVIPAPVTTVVMFFNLLQDNLLLHVGVSLYRIIVSVLISLAIGVPLGLWMGLNKFADAVLSPVSYILYPIPKIAFLPVFMMLLGLGDGSKLVLIITIIIFPILLAARDGVKEISVQLFDSVKSLGLNEGQIFTNLVIPAVMPKIISALRISIGISISALFFSENFATTYGLGYFIMNAWTMVRYIEMFAGILAISLMGLIIFKLIDLLEKKLCPWIFIKESRDDK